MIPRLRMMLAGSALVAAAAVAFAWTVEHWVGLVPCPLCLLERWPLRIAAGIGLVGLVLPRPWARLALMLLGLTVLADAAIAFVHVGVEHRLWLSPLAACRQPHLAAGSIAERLAQMPARPTKACEDATYVLDWLPVSLAEMNLLFTLAFAGAIATFLRMTRNSER
jgi:disulfide bond formation protein DsbB